MAKIVSFYSYKGGVGRSLLLANVAAALATTHRVACVDFDLEAGGLHTIFDVQASAIRVTALDLLTATGTPVRLVDITDRLPESATGKLLLLPTISEIDKVAAVFNLGADLPMLLGQMIAAIERQYQPHYILIDCRTGFSELASPPIRKSEKIVCVLKPNRQNIEGIRRLLDLFASYPRRPEILTVLSQVPNTSDAAKQTKKLETALGSGRRFDVKIPYVPELGWQETVVAITAPTSALAQQYGAITTWIQTSGKQKMSRVRAHG
jgi:MinD-like ATPase involved in chromosome partitioning or flagellar assembly